MYHRMIAEQAAAYAGRFDVPLEVTPRRRVSKLEAAWTLRWGGPGGPVETDYTYLRWDDIVIRRMHRTRLQTFTAAMRDAARLLRCGWFLRGLRLDPAAGAMTLYPYFWMLVLAALPVLAGLAAAWLAAGQGLPALLGLPVAALAVWPVLRLARWMEGPMYIQYLSHDFGFAIDEAVGRAPQMTERLDRFAEIVETAARSGAYDEVLVIGHSSGAYQAVEVLGRMIADHPEGPPVSLLTLGQSIGLKSFLPEAGEIRRMLSALAASERVDWVDVSSPRDALCLSLLDMTAMPDVPAPADRRNPLVVSARLDRIFTRATLRRLRLRIFDTHFIYMHANERPGAWDWIATIAGPQRLSARFAGRRGAQRARRGEAA
ncbi:hypothetical protein GE300_17980 [Rhodobacteraceae bacterium 2CG4]|uniref:Uncharacterized protein n=1 Tax=Halovulum marinum TaxID=2662447 RepID=A0A6L5Z4I1_9RHOB|nr:hypothetical protein [Halovulum marinum]MSU91471.1 hypothetical protein [Halovulum marinum]